MEYSRILLAGAARRLGSYLRKPLSTRWPLRSVDRKDIADSFANEEKRTFDLTDQSAVAQAMQGCDAVAHFATAIPMESESRNLFSCATSTAVIGTIALALGCGSGTVGAQTYPNKVIRMIIPAAPGGSPDIVSRVMLTKLSERLGQPVVLEHRPGAGGLGLAAAAQSRPDGYTLAVVALSFMATSPHLSKVNYDPIKDFAPITIGAYFDLAIVTHPSVPANTLSELIALAKKKPKSITMATAGNGTTVDLLAAALQQQTGVQFLMVPFGGIAPQLTAVLGGQVDTTAGTISLVVEQVKAGKLKAIGIASTRPSSMLPGVPTIVGQYPGADLSGWIGFVAPAGTPNDIVERLNREMVSILRTPEATEILERQGFTVAATSREEMAKTIRSEYERYGKLIKDLGMKVEQ